MANPYEQAAGIAAAFSNVGKQAFQGQGMYEAGRMKAAQAEAQQQMLGAHADLYGANAMKAKEEALALQQRRQYQAPEFATKLAASLAGLSEGQGAELSGFQQRGNWGVNPGAELPVGQEGPPRPDMPKQAPNWYTPQIEQRVNQARGVALGNLAGTGNSKIDDMAKAFAQLLDQGRVDQAIADPKYRANFGPAMAAADGKGEFNKLGNAGVFNQFSGKQDLNAIGTSSANENNAQAGNASASAALHRAQIPEVQSRIDLNRSKIGETQTITNPDGTQTVISSGKAAKPPTEFQGKSATYGARAKEAHDIINELESLSGKDAYSRLAAASLAGNGILNLAANPSLSENSQRAIQARRDFVNAVLRQESGAAISQGEFDNANRQYFPMPGDSAKTIAQKARTRETAILGFNKSAGPAQFDAHPIKSEQKQYTRTGTLNGRKVGMLPNGKTVYQDTGEVAE